ncbi:uncharacterized protein [Zea mays]|uniref:uncharacterized protein n=1 Tax=Zea mays TaxID=4577 RepID=UPI0004DECB2C|nr:uncharacterized protein LOC103627986 [Zea mays]|eukprot:XP_008646503.1 uncharacterized protein LOC103627986 [Zea mays]
MHHMTYLPNQPEQNRCIIYKHHKDANIQLICLNWRRPTFISTTSLTAQTQCLYESRTLSCMHHREVCTKLVHKISFQGCDNSLARLSSPRRKFVYCFYRQLYLLSWKLNITS